MRCTIGRDTIRFRSAALAALAMAAAVRGSPPELLASARPTCDLAEGFLRPPAQAKPRVYWWWLNSRVTREGITRDLEALAAKGVGGVLLFDAGEPAGPVPPGPAFMSDEWRALFRHAVREASRLSLEMSVNLCSGWDAGGPWITPELGCRRLAWSRITVTGPRACSEKLPLPAGCQAAHFADIAVQALPAPEDDAAALPKVTASSSQKDYPASGVADDSDATFWVSDGWKAGDGPRPDRPEWIRCDFPEPIEASFLTVLPRPGYGPRTGAVQIETAGGGFTTIAEFSFPNTGRAQTIDFPKVRAACFRLLITSAYTFGSPDSSWNVQVSELSFKPSGRFLSALAVKAARTPMSYERHGQSYVPALEDDGGAGDGGGAARPADVIDLSAKLGPDGRLSWDVPPGRWAVLRIGHAPAGYAVKCASPGGEGLEVDWLGARAMEHHFASTAAKLLEDAGPHAGTTLRYFHDDSWEVGVPNWTESFLDDFRKFRGYDARPYLPVLAGRIVGSPETADRFLYDYRKTLADCLALNHYGRFRELCHRHGVLLHTEGGGPCTAVPPMDALRNLGQNDVPMGEFWHSGHWKRGGQNDVGKQTASAAHTYGKRFAAAEAFTSMGPHWEEGPADLKPAADIAFCEGINRCFLHTSTLSPPEAGTPGQEYFAGTHFNANITWWEQASAWLDYLSRCQFLLSEGLPAADVCFYYGDHAPNFAAPKAAGPDLGPGYDYDVCDADVLLRRMRVVDGRIVLPDGVGYRLLALPERKSMPVEVLRKLKALVEAGATVIGPKPARAAGLHGYPESDALVRRLAGELWGPCDGASVTEHRAGKGRIVWGRTPQEVLQADGVGPDFAWAGGGDGTFLDFIHRSLEGTEIYFVANRRDRAEEVACSFRVSGRRPELWDPVTGAIREARAFSQSSGRTEVPLRLAPHGSIFVVFREPIARDAAGAGRRNWRVEGPPHAIAGPWTVRFDPAWGGPEEAVFDELVDWTAHPDPRIRFYSGTATYATTFDLPADLRGGSGRIALDLGDVKTLAEVRLNGRDLGVVWTAPWSVDITEAAKPAGNALEIRVVNLWPNRLIGDRRLEPAKRYAKTNVTKFTEDSPLLPSGLRGPVTVRRAQD